MLSWAMQAVVLIAAALGGLAGNALSCMFGAVCFSISGDYNADADYLRLLSGYLLGATVGAFIGVWGYARWQRASASKLQALLGALAGLLMGVGLDYLLLLLKLQLKSGFHLPHETLPDWLENAAFSLLPLATVVLGALSALRRGPGAIRPATKPRR